MMKKQSNNGNGETFLGIAIILIMAYLAFA